MKCSCRTTVLATLAVICFGALAQAQPGGGSPQRGPSMFRGGFGGGSLLGLARIEAVQKEIEVLDDQKTQIDKLSEELRGRRDGGDRPDYRNMSDEERQKLFAEMGKRREEQAKIANAKLAEILLPHQLKRSPRTIRMFAWA